MYTLSSVLVQLNWFALIYNAGCYSRGTRMNPQSRTPWRFAVFFPMVRPGNVLIHCRANSLLVMFLVKSIRLKKNWVKTRAPLLLGQLFPIFKNFAPVKHLLLFFIVILSETSGQNSHQCPSPLCSAQRA